MRKQNALIDSACELVDMTVETKHYSYMVIMFKILNAMLYSLLLLLHL